MCQNEPMPKLTINAENLRAIPEPAFAALVRGMYEMRGERPPGDDADEVHKAIGDGDDADEFAWAALRALWARSELAFTGYIDEVLAALDEMLRTGVLEHPFEPEKHERAVFETLADKAARFLANLGIDPMTAATVKERAPWAFDLIGEGYRLGLLGEDLGKQTPLTAAQAVIAQSVPTVAEREAIAYQRAVGGAFLRPVAQAVTDDVMRALTQRDREIARVRGMTGVRARIHPHRLAGYMADLTGHKVRREDGRMVWRDGDWSRDWRRVARTELARAHSEGHLQADLRRLPENAGKKPGEPLEVPKRLVFKITQAPRYDDKGRLIAPCKHCYRLWRADDGTPRLYDLAQIIENGDNALGDDGKARKAADWLATVGPTHPNDVCGPLQFATSVSPMLFKGMAAQFERFKGEGYEAVESWAAREAKKGGAVAAAGEVVEARPPGRSPTTGG